MYVRQPSPFNQPCRLKIIRPPPKYNMPPSPLTMNKNALKAFKSIA